MTMPKFTSILVALAVPLVIGGGMRLTAKPTVPPATQARDEVPTPREWVQFSAAVTSYQPGHDPIVGRLFRAGDGSTRIESGPRENPKAVISINNVSQQKAFMWNEKLGWLVMSWAPRVTTPPRLSVDDQKTFRHEEKVQGYDVIRSVQPNGQLNFIVPALNGEPIVAQHPQGLRKELTDIVVGPQPSELFEPPSDAVVKDMPPEFLKNIQNPTHRPNQ